MQFDPPTLFAIAAVITAATPLIVAVSREAWRWHRELRRKAEKRQNLIESDTPSISLDCEDDDDTSIVPTDDTVEHTARRNRRSSDAWDSQ